MYAKKKGLLRARTGVHTFDLCSKHRVDYGSVGRPVPLVTGILV
jgi:hypothetical protein